MRILKRAAFALLLLVVLLLGWGLVEPYLIDVEAQAVELSGLPPAWEGQRVALIADLQVGMWLDNTATVRRIVERVVRERPAALLVAGDFIYRPGERGGDEIAQVAQLLEPLAAAGIPTYAVLGNHDYSMPTKKAMKDEALAAELQRALEGIGVEVLQNEAVALAAPTPPDATPDAAVDAALHLVGVGSYEAGNDDVAAALAGVPAGAPRVVMMHHPTSFEALPAGAAPFAVAGHTHGGQFRIPFTPQWSWMTFTEDEAVHADGWIPDYGAAGNRLYVNRGIGFSVVPLRLNCPPELTLFTLRGA